MTNAERAERYKNMLSKEATAILHAAQERIKPRRSLAQLIEEAIYAAYGAAPQAPSAPTPTEPTSNKRIDF